MMFKIFESKHMQHIWLTAKIETNFLVPNQNWLLEKLTGWKYLFLSIC